ncbi:hemolysin [Photobacterium kishitanii]|nr:hemolysin [Photobacterium kishitanii]
MLPIKYNNREIRMKMERFILSSSSKVAVAITLAMISMPTHAAGIISGDGGPQVAIASNGAEIVDIVKPNQNGLSHNQYNQYNVNKSGAVLNNSLIAGQSQLAGKLGANHNLQGQAANLILNEVITRNPSLLLGKQEIFGMAADYVLANPNGITCDGCGFINTNRSSLVVGNPLIKNGKLENYQTDNQNKLLVNSQGLTTATILDLIAPSISVNGRVEAKEINAITGHNDVSRDTLTITESKGLPHAVDSYYLGSMQAGRIRIINTDEGSGVNLEGQFKGQDIVAVDTKGNLLLTAANIEGDNINLKGQHIRSQGKITTHTNKYYGAKNYQNYRGGIDINGQTDSQHLQRTALVGKNISIIAAKDNHLTATLIEGEDVAVKGGNIQLDSDKTVNKQRDTNNNWFYSQTNYSTTTSEKTQQHGTVIDASKTVNLISTQGDVILTGAKVTANKSLVVNSGGDIVLSGTIEKTKNDHNRNLRNHTSSLITGQFHDSNETDTLKSSQLISDGALGINAQQSVRLKAAKVQSKQDLIINAKKIIDISVQNTANNKTVKDNKTYWGGIGGGNNKNNSNNRDISHGSEIVSGGHLLVSAGDGINITGSKVSAKSGGFVQTQHGGLLIDNAISTSIDKVDNRNGTAFNITKNANKSTHTTQTVHGSALVSDVDLKLLSKKDIDVVGSLVKSAGTLGIESLGTINIKAAQQDEQLDQTKTKLSVDSYAKEISDKQYKAGVHIEHTATTEKTHQTKHIGSLLEGESVNISAQGDANFQGSKLKTTKGSANVSAENVSFLAEKDVTTTTKTQDTVGGGIYYIGGIDKAGSGYEAGFSKQKSELSKEDALVSRTDIAGNLIVNAKEKLTQQGTEHQVKDQYKETAKDVAHLAAISKDETKTTKASAGIDIGTNIDYSGITRPIEKAIKSGSKGGLSDAIDNIGKTGAANIGVDVTIEAKTSKNVKGSTTALVTKITAGSLDINAKQTVTDEGTQYNADNGDYKLTANKHIDHASNNTQYENNSETHGSGGLRVYTTTGEDLTINAQGQGGNSSSQTTGSEAVTGSIVAKKNIKINVTQDAAYQGVKIQAEQGSTKIIAGGDVQFEQANNTHSSSSAKLNANASGSIGTTPNNKNMGVGLGGGVEKIALEEKSAVSGLISSGDKLEIIAGHDINFQGTKVTSANDTVVAAKNKVNIGVAKSTYTNKESHIAGKLNLGGGSNDTKDGSDGNASIGGAVNLAFKDENAVKQQGSEFTSNHKISVNAGSNDNDAIHGIGAQLKAKDVALTADKGGIVLESAQITEHKNNWNVALNGNAAVSQSFKKDEQAKVISNSGADTHNLNVGLGVSIDKLDQQINPNIKINANSISIITQKDARLSGGELTADKISGDIGGNLNIESRNDHEHKVIVNVDTGIGHTNATSAAITSKLSKAGTPHYAKPLKEKLDNVVGSAADKVTEKYNTFARHHDKSQATTGAVSFNKAQDKVTLPEKLTEKTQEKAAWWDLGARKLGNGVKSTLVEDKTKGLSGHAGFSFDVVNNNSVTAQTEINAKEGVMVNVRGDTNLTGAKIHTHRGGISLGDSKIINKDMHGYNNNYSASLDVPFTVGGVASTITKGVTKGESPITATANMNKTIVTSAIINKL